MSQEKKDIKLFVSHRIDMDCDTFDNPLMVPVRCGAVYDERKDVDMLGDDTGDNISERRMSFCEMTVQYWAWKNVKADYYGLFHYRRFFVFSRRQFCEDPYGNVMDTYIDEDSERIYGLDEDTTRRMIEKYDMLVTKPKDVSKFPERYSSIWDHWNRAKDLHEEDLKTMYRVLQRMHPEMISTAKAYLDGTMGYFCSIYVMRADIFNDFCSWLYPILFELEQEIDVRTYSEEGKRTVGHLAERLLGIYIEYQKKERPELQICELQTVIFTEPQKRMTMMRPAFPEHKEQTIPIAFAASDAFAPICPVAIQSIVQNSDPDRYYDILILESAISPGNKNIIKSWLKGNKNVSVRFFNTRSVTEKYNLTVNQHLSVETYYRFLIQNIFQDYDKVLYMDGDLVCKHDVAELYDTDITGYLLAAVRDPDMNGQINLPNSDTFRYLAKRVHMRDPYAYFQAGVLLLNIREMRSAYSMEQWLGFASKRYEYADQDVLNRYCQGRVKYLPAQWNVLVDCNNYRVPVLIKGAAGDVSKDYFAARKDPYVIHFAGFQKPWNMRGVDFEWEFWRYARNSPFYEYLLLTLMGYVKPPENTLPPIGVKGAVKIYIRKKVDKFFPQGTRRRRFIKHFIRQ